ncbi:membrane protein insertase YidC [Apilactobacillus bombintestini]|uniref:Membrane protein insertase YidC n=1 Tax=Apilactobacillus bombintestini TaxID=2419772 RepID=A0A387ATJ5_9LACO|nr:membrane protein insertase YidC [Apilactobacillus bombintestini]AYF92056.1 membrane protein insertase YidC [Apilactobacillus bombintestini]
MKKIKKYLSLTTIVGLVFLLTACSNKPITSHSTGLWDGVIVLNFSRAIIWLAKLFGSSYGMGIVAFTIIVRIIILPLMIYQTKSMKKTQELQPKLKELQKKYSSKDTETMKKLREEQQRLYAEAGVNPVAGCLPLLVQLPILWALYQAIWRTNILKSGEFLWLQLGHRDPYFIMPVLAAVFTFLSSWLAMKSQPEQNGMTKGMMFGMPIIIFFMALNIPAAISIYWVVTNAFQAGQTLVIQNPWKIQKEREEKARAERQHQHKIEKAIRKAKKSHRK